jgi:hypothetical protein
MLVPALLALTLVTGQADPYEDEGVYQEPRDTGPFVIAWGGNAWNAAGGFSTPVWGGEVGWSFSAVDLGVAGYAYKNLYKENETAQVVLTRIGERFESHRGLEGSLTFGIGAVRHQKWTPWFQVALGVRMLLGPIFVAGEITFEQENLIRLAGGLGVRF